MKLTLGVTDFSDETFRFAAQLGVTHLKLNGGELLDEQQRGVMQAAKLRPVQTRMRELGLGTGVVLLPQGQGTQHWNVRLGRPEREDEVRDVCSSIEVLGGEGVPTVEYVFNLAAVYGSESLPIARGGAVTRHFDYDKVRDSDRVPEWEAPEAEVWERIRFFLERVVPVAEKAGVKLACHHDDPPVPLLRGETRVLGSLEGMKRLVELVPSPANGLNFCQGTVTEMGVDVIEAIRTFGAMGKIHHVHFRNVRGAIPRFQETFIDDGDVDMLAAMRAYKEVGYEGTIMPDHTPLLVGDTPWRHAGRAYAIGYMKALMEAAGVRLEPPVSRSP